MPLHGRYTNSIANDERASLMFWREDLLWKNDVALLSPSGRRVEMLPISISSGYVVGPTILDMMVRQVVPVTSKLREQYDIPEHLDEAAFWVKRPTSTLWPTPRRPSKQGAKSTKAKTVDHPFEPGLASGGHVVRDAGDFVLVRKRSTISISALALKLTVGMTGGIDSAYSRISDMAVQAWDADLRRSLKLWQRINAVDKLFEDEDVAGLRPISSISQEVERLVMRQACTWLGVDPDLDCSRPRGRPPGAAAESGKIIRITVTADERLEGELLADFYGIKAGTNLSDLDLRALVELLGALRLGQYEFDAELVEAFLDAAAPDWREQATADAGDENGSAGVRYDPYEILGVPRDTPLEDVTKAYRRAMQRVHPDQSALGPWFAQMVSEAYRHIRHERGEQ